MKRRWAWIGVVVVLAAFGAEPGVRLVVGRARDDRRGRRGPPTGRRAGVLPPRRQATRPLLRRSRSVEEPADALSSAVPKRATTSSTPKTSTASLSRPRNRFDAMKTDRTPSLKKEPNKVGMLPYAIMEYYEKLTVGFYDYRKTPTNSAIPMKCLVYGGMLAHYTGDAAMPLHTTRDFDGRTRPDGTVKQKGIHAKRR